MFSISDRVYDILKWAVGVVLPALAALYVGVSGIFGLPMPEQVASTIMALVLFLGAFLQMSSASWAIERAQLTGRIYKDENGDGIPDYPFKMSGPVYETVKWLVQVALPALSVAYVAMAKVWGWPASESVPAVVSAVVLFLSTVLQFSTANYNRAVASLTEPS